MRYELLSSLNFGQVIQDRQTDRRKAMHKSPSCICTGGLKHKKKNTISLLEVTFGLDLTMSAIQQTDHLICLQCVNNSGKTDKLYLHPKNNSFLGKVMQKLSKYDNEISPNRGLESI